MLGLTRSQQHYLQAVQAEGLWIDDSDNKRRIIVPAHGVGHFGAKHTALLLKQHYVWPFMTRDIKSYIDFCNICKIAKCDKILNKKQYTPIKFPFSDKLKFIHIDIVGREIRG